MGDRAHTRKNCTPDIFNNGIVRGIETGTFFIFNEIAITSVDSVDFSTMGYANTFCGDTISKLVGTELHVGELHDGHQNSVGTFQKDYSQMVEHRLY